MKKKPLLHLLNLVLFSVTGACGPADVAETEEDLIARAQGIHDRVITLDTHIDINTGNFTPERNYTTDVGTQVNLPKMRHRLAMWVTHELPADHELLR